MGFPAVQTTSTGNSGANATAHTITLPTGIVNGELCVVVFGNDSSATTSVTTPATGWSSAGSATANGAAARISIFWRRCDGAEGATITITTSVTEGSSYTAYRISGHDVATDPDINAPVTGTTQNPNPGSNDPPWAGAADVLWIAAVVWDGNISASTYPTNYSIGQLTDRWANTAGCGVASACRQFNTDIEDPGTFGLSAATEETVSATLAILGATAVAFKSSWAKGANQVLGVAP